jgi:hypothetical protein
MSGKYKKEKKVILDKLNELGKKIDQECLIAQELDLKRALQNRLAHMSREEEI